MKGFLGKGILRVAPYLEDKSALIYRDTGNCTQLQPTLTEQTVNIPNMRDGSGGDDESLDRLQNAVLNVTLTSLLRENEEIAHRASSTVISTSLAVTDEAHKASPGYYVRADYLIDLAVAPVVTDSTGTTTYVAGTDYLVKPMGLEIPETSSIPANSDIKLSYTRVSQYVLEALIGNGGYFSVMLEGYNEFSGEYEAWEWYKVRFSLVESFNLIANEHSPLVMKGRVLRDSSITSGSQFYRVWRPE